MPDTNASFIDLLDRWGRLRPPSLPVHVGEFQVWQDEFRAALDGLRGPLPERAPLDVTTVACESFPDHTRHQLLIRVNEFSLLPAYLLIPADMQANERRPAVVALHGHVPGGIDALCGVGQENSECPAPQAYALRAVRAGYVTLAPAWWGWPGRDGHLDPVGARDRCNVIQMAASMYGFHVLDLHIQDGQAAIDLLADRQDVDSARIACLGNSYGGRTTMWLTIFDPRIVCCVPAGCMNTFRERSLKLSSCGIQYLPGVLRFGDVAELFALIAPRPMQLHVGAQDPLITPADRDAILATVRSAYRACRAEDNLDYVCHEGGHLLAWEAALPFLRRWLGEAHEGR